VLWKQVLDCCFILKSRELLSQIDLIKLTAKQFSSERLAVVRDIFPFSIYNISTKLILILVLMHY